MKNLASYDTFVLKISREAKFFIFYWEEFKLNKHLIIIPDLEKIK